MTVEKLEEKRHNNKLDGIMQLKGSKRVKISIGRNKEWKIQ
jgi:hypothetical protein